MPDDPEAAALLAAEAERAADIVLRARGDDPERVAWIAGYLAAARVRHEERARIEALELLAYEMFYGDVASSWVANQVNELAPRVMARTAAQPPAAETTEPL